MCGAAQVSADILPQLVYSLGQQNRFYKKAAAFVLRTVAKHSPELAKVCVGVSLNQLIYLFVIVCPMCLFVTRAGGGGLERA